MSRVAKGVLVVSALDVGDRRLNTCMIEEAFDGIVPGGTFALDCSASDREFLDLRGTPPAVQAAGAKLYRALVRHAPLQALFAQTMKPNGVYPLYIRVDTPDAEDFPWETLWDTQTQFFVLDPQGRWPIARQANRRLPEPLQQFITDELRVAVVLAAAKEKGAEEWAKISTAIDNFKTPVDLLALVSEDETRDAIKQDAARWAGQTPAHKARVTFTGDSSSLLAELRTHLPNVIHFFCHGVAEAQPQLELETRSDRKTKKERGSIALGSTLLSELARIKSLWLVVLNCCQGAKTAPQLHSLARDLIAAGVPAVVAMRESVEVADANLFTEHFYADLLAQLHAVFKIKETAAAAFAFPETVWTRAVHTARRKLSGSPRDPSSSAQWTYPVVYVHRDELTLKAVKLKETALSDDERLMLLTELDMLRLIRATIDPTVDPEAAAKRAQFDARIAQIEAQLGEP